MTNSFHYVNQSDAIELSLSDHELIHCTEETTTPKYNKDNKIDIRSKKNYAIVNLPQALKENNFPNYQNYSCLNIAYQDIVKTFVEAVNSLCPSKKVGIKVSTKAWFDSEIDLSN